MEQLGQANILITNFHAFQLRETVSAGKLTKAILAGGRDEPVHRNARPDGAPRLPRTRQQEEHRRHQRRGPSLLPAKTRCEVEKLTGDDRKEAKSREEEARVWISGVEAVKAKIGVKADLRSLRHALLPARAPAIPKARSSRGSSPISR